MYSDGASVKTGNTLLGIVYGDNTLRMDGYAIFFMLTVTLVSEKLKKLSL